MPTFDTDRGVPLPRRTRAFADALEAEGRPRTAAHLRAAADAHDDLHAAGRPHKARAHLVTALSGFVSAREIQAILSDTP